MTFMRHSSSKGQACTLCISFGTYCALGSISGHKQYISQYVWNKELITTYTDASYEWLYARICLPCVYKCIIYDGE